MREANSQGVGTGVGAGGRQGQVINRIQSTGAGTVCSGTIGSESLQCLTAPAPPTSGIKIEHTVWREIK
jgi:hypothetical protein